MNMCRYRWLERERLGSEPGVEPCGECSACTAAAEQEPADEAAGPELDDAQPGEQPARSPRASGGRRPSA